MSTSRPPQPSRGGQEPSKPRRGTDRPQKRVAALCRVCGSPGDRLLMEPDYWLCKPCSDRLGDEWLDEGSCK